MPSAKKWLTPKWGFGVDCEEKLKFNHNPQLTKWTQLQVFTYVVVKLSFKPAFNPISRAWKLNRIN